MKRAYLIVALVVSLGFVSVQTSFGDVYYVCWQRVRIGDRDCIRCNGPFRSNDPVTDNAGTRCPGGKGETFNSERDAWDWVSNRCNCP